MKMKSSAHWLSIIINNESLLALLAWLWLQEGCGAWSWDGTARLHLWGSEQWFPGNNGNRDCRDEDSGAIVAKSGTCFYLKSKRM